MSEILYYQRVLTQNEINTIVGYLGQKWGIKTEVPSAPIENAVSKWLPNKESKLAIWLDMADYSSMIVNKTTTISSIKDKIGGVSFTPSGNLTLSSTSSGVFGNISSLNFDNNSGDNVYMTGTYNYNTSGSILFIANLLPTTNTNEAIIKWNDKLKIGFENNNNILLGYGFINTQKYLPNSKEKIGTNEHRIFQQFITRQSFNKVFIQHRYRIEERFFSNDFQMRFRYFLGINIPINKPRIEKNAYYLSAYNEIFINAQQNIFDRNRLYGAIGYVFNKNIKMEAGYMAQTVETNNRNQFQIVLFNNIPFTNN